MDNQAIINKQMSQAYIDQLIATELQEVNRLVLEQLNSEVSLINQLGYHIISGGGKRIRPTITILAANSLGYKGNKHITTAALIEFIHTATLLHDDVVDESNLRRGKATANAVFGNAASILVGDFIYTRAFQMMTQLNSLRILEVMSDAMNVIAEGEVMQLMNCNDPSLTEEQYMKIIYSKTARLFEVAAQTSAILAGASPEQEQALKDYGRYIGTAFQLIDDMLDYNAESAKKLGKNLGDDLSEGKTTLPMIHLLQHGSPIETDIFRQIIERGDARQFLDHILQKMHQYGSLEYTYQRAVQEANKAIAAIAHFPESESKTALQTLAELSVQRNF